MEAKAIELNKNMTWNQLTNANKNEMNVEIKWKTRQWRKKNWPLNAERRT